MSRNNRFDAAARLTALETDPKLGDDLQSSHRHDATARGRPCRSRSWIGRLTPRRGREEPVPRLGPHWFHADLALCRKTVRRHTDRAVVVNALEPWKECGDLAGIRDAAALAKLPADEQKDWQAHLAGWESWSRGPRTPGAAPPSRRVPVPELKTVVPTSKKSQWLRLIATRSRSETKPRRSPFRSGSREIRRSPRSQEDLRRRVLGHMVWALPDQHPPLDRAAEEVQGQGRHVSSA